MSDRIASITAIDTSVIVPGLLSWHEKHEAASAALVQLLGSESKVVLPLHSLVEAYAVMTRLPPPHRLSAKDARRSEKGSSSRISERPTPKSRLRGRRQPPDRAP